MGDDTRYFIWLCDQIDMGDGRVKRYSNVLSQLFDTNYIGEGLDTNRAVDGIALREKFESGYDREGVPCTMLEMMVALAIRLEYDVAGEPGEEIPGRWFWVMFDELNLDLFSNDAYDMGGVDTILSAFNRGQVGLFPGAKMGKGGQKDDVWRQGCVYLNSIFE